MYIQLKTSVSPVLIDRISEKPCFYEKMNCMIRILHAVGENKERKHRLHFLGLIHQNLMHDTILVL